MERINFPQITGQSDIYDPRNPGRYHAKVFSRLDELEDEYKKRL
jgi:hypothetical protein